MSRHGRAQPFQAALYSRGSTLASRDALVRLQSGRPAVNPLGRRVAWALRFTSRVLVLTLGFWTIGIVGVCLVFAARHLLLGVTR